MPQYYSLYHSGIPGMKWHRRRFRNYDGSLTEAGKIRYGVGGDKAVKKAEKEKRRRDKILSDPKKLQRHLNEFTTAELQNAQTRFDAINKLKEQQRTEKLAEAKAKTDVAQAKAQTERQKAEAKAAKQRAVFDKKRFEAEEERKKIDQERKMVREDKEANAAKWKQRMLKLSNILTISKNGKEIFDELGITDPADGKTLFGSLGKAMGWDKKIAAEVLGSSEKKDSPSSKSEKSESPKAESKPNSEQSSQNESKSSSDEFAGWESDAKYKDTTKKNLRAMARAEKKAYKQQEAAIAKIAKSADQDESSWGARYRADAAKNTRVEEPSGQKTYTYDSTYNRPNLSTSSYATQMAKSLESKIPKDYAKAATDAIEKALSMNVSEVYKK